jgi:N-sulfoglucosamine sulfohydrolase
MLMKKAFLIYCAMYVCVVAAQAVSSRPDVLLIVSEDNGPELGCYGDRFARTPHLDHLAAEGARFEHAYVTQAGCSQSRSSILTGLYPHQNGQIALATHRFRMFSKITPNIPAALHAAGYRTGVIGKIHVNPESAFKFDLHDGRRYNSFGNRDVMKVAKEAMKFIESSEEPFFLMVNYADAHQPWHRQQHGLPEKPFTAKEVEPLPYVALRTPEVLKGTADYYNCLSRLDTGIGALLAGLEKSGRSRNTLVIYLGDHGAEMPRGKMTSYEGGVRIPLLMRWPVRLPAGSVIPQLISTVDLFPTLLQACGLPPLDHLAGRSLLPLFQSPQPAWREHLFTEFTAHWPESYFPSRTVRDDRYKLIVNLLPDTPNPVSKIYLNDRGSKKPGFEEIVHSDLLPAAFHAAYDTFARPPEFELYDLQDDPLELNNLAADPAHTETLKRLRTVLDDWRQQTADELRHPEKLARFTREIRSTFVDGSYQKPPADFDWEYPSYLSPGAATK